MKKIITIGSSVSFYKDVADIRQKLLAHGFDVLVPDVVTEMEESGSYDESAQRERYEKYSPEMKRRVITYLFEKIEKSDAFLVVNNEKHGLKGYIGPNVLMEIAVAVYLGKQIFILNEMDDKIPSYKEVIGIQPVFLNSNLSMILSFLQKETL